MKNETIDISKIVPCTDIDKVIDLHAPKLKFNSHENKDYLERTAGKVSLQWMMDKYAKNNAWNVMRMEWSPDPKQAKYRVLRGKDEYEDIVVSCEDICKELWWHSFEVTGPDTVSPVPFTEEEKDSFFKKAIAETKKKDEAWKVEHGITEEQEEAK